MSRNDDATAARLLAAARAVAARAYAPYSGHPVGAAIEDAEGRIHTGCNVENAAYPQGTCAEAGAIAAMIAAGGRRIVAAAVAGPGDVPCTPCGGCRQRLREFAGPEVAVFCAGASGPARRLTVAELLPAAFGPENLDR